MRWACDRMKSESGFLFLMCLTVQKCHLCPVRLLISASSVTPAVEKEVDSSSVSILPREGDELSGCIVSTSAADSRNNRNNSVSRMLQGVFHSLRILLPKCSIWTCHRAECLHVGFTPGECVCSGALCCFRASHSDSRSL